MNTRAWGRSALAAFLILAGSAAAQSLITNGGFEQVQIPPGNSQEPTNIPGWTHAGTVGEALLWSIGYTDIDGSITVAGDGRQFVTIGGGYFASGTASWTQLVNGLSPGVTYRLDFKMASEADFSGPQSLTVEFISGSSTNAQTFGAAAPPFNYWSGWESKTMYYTAPSNQVALVFTATTMYDVGLDAVSLAAACPVFTAIGQLGTNVVAQGTNGVPGGSYHVLATTNLALPLTNWTSVASNLFDSGGNFAFTNGIVLGRRCEFYLLQLP
jgi:hypothetical protein